MRQKLLGLYRETLTKVARLENGPFDVHLEAIFHGSEFSFHITAFIRDGSDNRTLRVYDFYSLSKSKSLVSDYLAAIASGDFEKVTEVASR